MHKAKQASKQCYLAGVSGDKRHPLGHMAAVLTCQAVGKDLLKELQAWKQLRFSDWSSATGDKLQDIKMDQSGKLMDMDSHDGRIKLHYNEELVVLLREVSLHTCGTVNSKVEEASCLFRLSGYSLTTLCCG